MKLEFRSGGPRVGRGNGTDIDCSRAHTEEEVKMWAKMEEAQVSEL